MRQLHNIENIKNKENKPIFNPFWQKKWPSRPCLIITTRSYLDAEAAWTVHNIHYTTYWGPTDKSGCQNAYISTTIVVGHVEIVHSTAAKTERLSKSEFTLKSHLYLQYSPSTRLPTHHETLKIGTWKHQTNSNTTKKYTLVLTYSTSTPPTSPTNTKTQWRFTDDGEVTHKSTTP